MQRHGSKIPRPWVGSKGQNSTFSEHGHVAYQIKWNHGCSNMAANILPSDPPINPKPLGAGSKGQNSTLFQIWPWCYQIEGDYTCSNMVANILPANPLPSPPHFLEHGHVANQIKQMQQHGSEYFPSLPPPPPPPPRHTHQGWGVKFQFFQNMVMLHNKLTGIIHATTW